MEARILARFQRTADGGRQLAMATIRNPDHDRGGTNNPNSAPVQRSGSWVCPATVGGEPIVKAARWRLPPWDIAREFTVVVYHVDSRLTPKSIRM